RSRQCLDGAGQGDGADLDHPVAGADAQRRHCRARDTDAIHLLYGRVPDLSGRHPDLDVGSSPRRRLGKPRCRRGAALMLDVAAERWPRFVDGAVIAICYAAMSCVAGFAAAIPLALMRLSSNPVTFWASTIYVLFFRGTPLLAQI